MVGWDGYFFKYFIGILYRYLYPVNIRKKIHSRPIVSNCQADRKIEKPRPKQKKGDIKMSELQTKLGGGLNMLQGSLQQGKQKLQIAQEISQQKKLINENAEKKAELLLKMGEMVYKKIRTGEIADGQLDTVAKEIIQFDQRIYQSQQTLAQLNMSSQQRQSCTSCGGPITTDDKFCGACGQKVEHAQATTRIETEACPVCEADVPVNTAFCVCCGNQMVGGEV